MLFWGLVLLCIPFVLPVISFVQLSRLRRRMAELDETVDRQQTSLDDLGKRMAARKESAQRELGVPVAR